MKQAKRKELEAKLTQSSQSSAEQISSLKQTLSSVAEEKQLTSENARQEITNLKQMIDQASLDRAALEV